MNVSDINLPRPLLHAGGTGDAFASALQGIEIPQRDAKGRRLLSDLRAARSLTIKERTLINTHVFLVMIPRLGTTALFSGGLHSYHDYIQFDAREDGSLGGIQENQSDARQNFWSNAGTLKLGEPCLIEFHPLPEERSQLLINGKEIAKLSARQSLNYFASGYRGAASASALGEIRFYENLSADEVTSIRFAIRSYWDMQGGMPISAQGEMNDAGWLTDGVDASACYALTLRRSKPSSSAKVKSAMVVSTSGKMGFNPRSKEDGIPEEITLLSGQTWRLQVTPPASSADALSEENEKVHFTFSVKDCLPLENLGNYGSYVLLHKSDSSQRWQALAATSPTEQGIVHFPDQDAISGTYVLAVKHGLIYQQPSSELLFNGNAQDQIRVKPGEVFDVQVKNSPAGQRLRLIESSSGLEWYKGPADQCSFQHRVYRHGKITLVAEFEATLGFFAKKKELQIILDPAMPHLYPGLKMQHIADASQKQKLDESSFKTDAQWPKEKGGIDSNYPAFRTAESVHPIGIMPARALYHHTVIPTLALTRDAKKIPLYESYPSYPEGDLMRPTRISGFIIPQKLGNHEISLQVNRAAILTIGGKSAASQGAGSIAIPLDLNSLNPLALELIIPANDDPKALECFLQWKLPDASEITSIPASALFHTVDSERESALARHSNQFAHRFGSVANDLPDSVIPELVPAERPEALQALAPLVNIFMHGKTRSGDVTIARAVLAHIRARLSAMRSGKLPTGRNDVFIGVIRGDDLALYLAWQPFFFALENHPTLQHEALQTRAEIACYLHSMILGRSFFKEAAWGANDCYGGEHNFAGAVWSCAQFIDSPYAWDAACNLFDNQFRYCPGTAEGLHSDGTFTFHNVNGRQIHHSGYAADWLYRIGIGKNDQSPWAMTPEQARRLARFALAHEWFFYRDTCSFFVNGRHNFHQAKGLGVIHDPVNVANYVLDRVGKILPAAEHAELEQLLVRQKNNPENTITGQHFFSRNLAFIHRQQDFYIENKMNSPLIAGPETFRGLLPWNMGFGDGFTALMRHGKEYAALHRNAPNAYQYFQWNKNAPKDVALWAYAARPGVTQLDNEQLGMDRYRVGAGTHAGGVCDGERGSMGFEFNAKAVHHFKFNAFTPDGLASLTTNITATDAKYLVPGSSYRTNLNQCEWNSPVIVTRQSGESTTIAVDAKDSQISLPLNQRYLVQHDGISYLVLPTGAECGVGKPGTLDLALSTRTPLSPLPGYTPSAEQVEWITEAKLNQTRIAKVFHLSINHGPNPQQGQAAYFISMTHRAMADVSLLQIPPIEVLKNQPQLQALKDARDNTIHAFFREAGEFKCKQGTEIKTPAPLILMWRPETHRLSAYDPRVGGTADASQYLKKTTIEIMGKPQILEFPFSSEQDDRYYAGCLTQTITP